MRIFKKNNQPPLQTALSNENGGFQLNKPDTGNYILSFTHTGTNINTPLRRAAVLALTWNFGKLTENVSKKKGVNNDDILSKPVAPGGN